MCRLTKIALITTGLAAALLFATVAAGCGGGSAPAGSAAHPGATPSNEMRTVVVSSDAEPPPSRPGEPLRALRLEGSVPSRPVAATVLTDEDCAPDADGVSHCTNRLRLPGGRTLVVRHPHRMMEVPCLEPGEHVMVSPA
jgi:hypothetical protein